MGNCFESPSQVYAITIDHNQTVNGHHRVNSSSSRIVRDGVVKTSSASSMDEDFAGKYWQLLLKNGFTSKKLAQAINEKIFKLNIFQYKSDNARNFALKHIEMALPLVCIASHPSEISKTLRALSASHIAHGTCLEDWLGVNSAYIESLSEAISALPADIIGNSDVADDLKAVKKSLDNAYFYANDISMLLNLSNMLKFPREASSFNSPVNKLKDSNRRLSFNSKSPAPTTPSVARTPSSVNGKSFQNTRKISNASMLGARKILQEMEAREKGTYSTSDKNGFAPSPRSPEVVSPLPHVISEFDTSPTNAKFKHHRLSFDTHKSSEILIEGTSTVRSDAPLLTP